MSRLLVLLCFVAQSQPGPVMRLYPVDDTARDSTFRSYVAKLREAVETRNAGALRKLTDKDVTIGPGADDKGWAKFTARWKPDDPRDSRLWSTLADLLSVGFIREHPQLFLSPYLVWRFPEGLDRSSHLVVVRDNAPLREAPSVNAAPVAVLSFDIVKQIGRPVGEDRLVQWVRVSTLDGRSGYLNMRDVMTPMMPRAQFSLNRGRWLLVALESED